MYLSKIVRNVKKTGRNDKTVDKRVPCSRATTFIYLQMTFYPRTVSYAANYKNDKHADNDTPCTKAAFKFPWIWKSRTVHAGDGSTTMKTHRRKESLRAKQATANYKVKPRDSIYYKNGRQRVRNGFDCFRKKPLQFPVDTNPAQLLQPKGLGGIRSVS